MTLKECFLSAITAAPDGIARRDLRAIAGCSNDVARTTLQEMRRAGLIESAGGGRARLWCLPGREQHVAALISEQVEQRKKAQKRQAFRLWYARKCDRRNVPVDVPAQVVVPAHEAKPLRTRAVSSVWQLAEVL